MIDYIYVYRESICVYFMYVVHIYVIYVYKEKQIEVDIEIGVDTEKGIEIEIEVVDKDGHREGLAHVTVESSKSKICRVGQQVEDHGKS